jgi:hypothetical protein
MDQHFAIQQAALKLQLCQLQAYTSNHRVTSNSRGNGSSQAVLPLQLAGFNCSSSHDLSREFVGAEPEEQQAAAGSRKAASRGKGARGTQEEEVGRHGAAMLACVGSVLLTAYTALLHSRQQMLQHIAARWLQPPSPPQSLSCAAWVCCRPCLAACFRELSSALLTWSPTRAVHPTGSVP